MLERDCSKVRFEENRLRTYLRLCVDSFVMNEDKAEDGRAR